MNRKLLIFLGFITIFSFGKAQPLSNKKGFTRQDTLRGSLNAERTWWDVLNYDISVKPDYAEKSIEGELLMEFKVLKAGTTLQIDLQEPMQITGITWKNKPLIYAREGNAFHVNFPQPLKEGKEEKLKIQFQGHPKVAKRAPWDGGWIFTTDKQGRAWMSVACQGLGASVWYPCKDHQSDEPDKGATLRITVPDSLVAVGNGRLSATEKSGKGFKTYVWKVTNPINNYNIIPYIGHYTSWKEVYPGEKGDLDCEYWVLDYDLDKAKEQFKQVPKMLKSFEYWFGPYPFYEDSYKLVQAPHLGMEHQSAVAYGNEFGNGYRGKDLSGSGWGMKWDFIIVHESGHEWFANNVTSNDIADMWLHESFTNYSETLFTTSEFGVEAGNDYVIGTRKLIRNDQPIIGPYGVNQEGSGDMYYKGGNLLHNIRTIIHDDAFFRKILRGIQSQWYHHTVDSKDVEAYIQTKTGKDLSKIFDQYLRTTKIPELQYKSAKGKTYYKWSNCVKGFNMPVDIKWGADQLRIHPTEEWQLLPIELKEADLVVNRNYYVTVKKVKA